MFYLFHLFRSFLPLHNPIGFGASDFIELAIALTLVGLALTWRRLVQWARWLAPRTAWCMALLTALPVALRLLLLPAHPIPAPAVADDFSYLLLADTLSHFRLTNPPHPMHQFFETFFELQQPTYSSVYPLAQGIVLAFGQIIFSQPWAGVALSIGILCALCYWMLRAWTTPGWALLGGLLAVVQFGPLNQWMNSYWGGAVSAIAGCLVFGALPRLRERGRYRDGLLVGLGLGIQLLSRPFESIFLDASVVLFLLPTLTRRRDLLRPAAVIALAALPFVCVMSLHDKRVTNNWTTIPSQLSQYQYGIPTTFTFQALPVPHRELTREQELDYEVQLAAHGKGRDTIREYFSRLASRVKFYRFFYLAPLYLALPFFIVALREYRFAWVLATVAIFAAGSNFYPYFYSHYIAAITCLFVLIGIVSLRQLSGLSAEASRWIVFLCLAHFMFWYGLHLFGNEDFSQAMWQYETWDAINHGDPESRIAIRAQLTGAPGKQLVFVRYGPQHAFKEWVFNSADIDGSRIVWARDLGPAQDERLCRFYPDRTVWMLEPDARPPKLGPYHEPPKEEAPPPKPSKEQHPKLKFEEVK